MATTITLDSRTVEAVQAVTKERNKATAVRKVLDEYLRREKLRELADMAGTVDLRFSNREIEEMEQC